MTQINFKGISLNSVTVTPPDAPEQVRLPLHHIVVTDVSGSMYGDLPALRKHLKNKLLSLVGADDTLSLVWFSGKGQCGILQEGIRIANLTDLTSVHNAIDRFLVPQCLTGFKEPLELVSGLIDRLQAADSGHATNLIFMTDGYDNQWNKNQIIDACSALAPKVDSASIIEYGWYTNRPLMEEMAEVLGGSVLFAENQEDYQLSAEAALTRTVKGGKRVTVDLGKTKYPYAFSFADGAINTIQIKDGSITVPESIGTVYYFGNGVSGDVSPVQGTDAAVYPALALLAQRKQTDDVFSILRTIGDVALAKKFMNCFSKQDYVDFTNLLLAAATDESKRYVDGFSESCIPRDDAFTVLDLLGLLESDAGNLFYPLHPAFSYNRIGKKSEQKDEDKLVFQYADRNAGFPINGLVYNEDRANVSMRVRFTGTVKLPANDFDSLPADFPTYSYRNYTIIKDGIVNTRELPVSLSQSSIDVLVKEGVIPANSVAPGELFVLDIRNVPIINRKMVNTIHAADFFGHVLVQNKAQASAKVVKYFRDMYCGEKKSLGFSIVYGEAAADWLKSIGITDYNGFNPPSTSVKTGDFYTATEFTASIKGISSLPTVKSVIDKIDAGKTLTPREAIMHDTIEQVRAAINVIPEGASKNDTIIAYLKAEADDLIAKTRNMTTSIAKTKFAIMVGKGWFHELASDATTYDLGGYTFVFDLKDKEFEL